MRSGRLNPTAPFTETVSSILGGLVTQPVQGFNVGIPVSVTVPIARDDQVYAVLAPLDSVCTVLAVAVIEVASMEPCHLFVGVSADSWAPSDSLLDKVSLQVQGAVNALDSDGENAALYRVIRPGQYVVYNSDGEAAGTRAFLVLTFTPLGV